MSYNSISVICPCYNEEPNIDELIFRVENVLKKINEPYEIILIDDASTDKTWLKIQDHSNKNPNIKSYKHKKNLGLAETWKTGVNMAEKNLSIVIDSDLQYQPEDIYRLYNYLILNKTDIVQGWRSSIERKINFRFIASKILNNLLNLMFNMNLKDNKSGFIICETVILKDILSHKFKYNYYQTFLLIAANKKKYTISDIEVIFEERTSGKSFLPNIPIIASLKVLIDICKAFVEFNFLKNTDDDLLESYSQRINDKNSRSLASKLLLNIYFITLPLHT